MNQEENLDDIKIEIEKNPKDTDYYDEPDESLLKISKKEKKLKKKIKELETEAQKHGDILKKVIDEREQSRDRYLRTLAEMDNFKKRLKKEKEDYQKYILGDFLLQFLETFDNLERALSVAEDSDKEALLSGVKMIHKQIVDLMKKNKVEEITALEKEFDPSIHQALSKEEKEGIEQDTVCEVYQKGFLYNKKLLRPALVKVAQPVKGE